MGLNFLDRIVEESERKVNRSLQKQESQALEDIAITRKLFSKHKRDYVYELGMLEKMEVYVRKYKFLPDSFNRMMIVWTANFLGKK